MRLDEIDLSDIDEFWTRPMADRHAAFATLRTESPIHFFPEPELEYLPTGPGYWAITKHRDIIEASPSSRPLLFGARHERARSTARVQRVLRLDDQHG